jgi:hypothetical protein
MSETQIRFVRFMTEDRQRLGQNLFLNWQMTHQLAVTMQCSHTLSCNRQRLALPIASGKTAASRRIDNKAEFYLRHEFTLERPGVGAA